jgi:hypothetical protein
VEFVENIEHGNYAFIPDFSLKRPRYGFRSEKRRKRLKRRKQIGEFSPLAHEKGKMGGKFGKGNWAKVPIFAL